MQYTLKTTYFTAQERVIHNIGDKVWEALCNNFPLNGIIRASHCRTNPAFMRESGLYIYKPRTARNYLNAILANVAAQDGSSLEKIGKGAYVWVKGDEGQG